MVYSLEPNIVPIRHSLRFAIDKISFDEKVPSRLCHIPINAKFQFDRSHLMKFQLFLNFSLFSLSGRKWKLTCVECGGKREKWVKEKGKIRPKWLNCTSHKRKWTTRLRNSIYRFWRRTLLLGFFRHNLLSSKISKNWDLLF